MLHQSLETLARELVEGAGEGDNWMLNPNDVGLLRSLDRLPASAASTTPPSGGASIAAHVEHVQYGLSLMNRWARGGGNPWANADWTAAWKRVTVTDQEWAALRQSLAAEARAWIDNIRQPREYALIEMNGVMATLAHLAYHVGAIRQIDRSIRGPAA